MNIRAGQKLCGRNPRQAPASAAVRSAAVAKICWLFTKISRTENEKNATAPIPTTPAASPSRPSMKFTAFIVVTMMSTVSRAAWEPLSVNMETEPPGERQPEQLHPLDDDRRWPPAPGPRAW